MTENYDIVVKTLNILFTILYSTMNDYLENIFNAPSTINRIMKYYAIGFNVDKPLERYVMFRGKIVAVFKIELKGDFE